MTPPQTRTDPRADTPAANLAARLELLEYFLEETQDVRRCAHRSLAWLARHADIGQSICLVVDFAATRLVAIAGHGIGVDDIEGVSWPISDIDTPMVAAIAAAGPVIVIPVPARGLPSRSVLPPAFSDAPLMAIPLHETHDGEMPLDPSRGTGVLLVSGAVTMTVELAWLVSVLGRKIEELSDRGRLAERLRMGSDELQDRVEEAIVELGTQNELLRRQALDFDQASRLKAQFLANMSHEFRTPLNAILGYTYLLRHGVAGDLPSHAAGHLTRIDANGRHLLRIINEILDITRIEAGKMPLQLSEFDLNDLVTEVIDDVDALVVPSNLTLRAAPCPARPLVWCDRHKVKQIIVNLLSNALKFTLEGGVSIAVGLSPASGRATIAVTDTGIGIAPENHAKIFEDFNQVDNSPTRPYGGTGLGLAVCRRLAGAMGAQISLTSTLNLGSTFTLTIPVEAAS